MYFVGDVMLEENTLLSFPTEEDLPDCDEKPVDNELQLLAPMLLGGILSYIWDDRLDWFFGINLGVYPVIDQPAMVEVYRLEKGRYVRQFGNPVWMPEVGLGIGHEEGSQDRNRRDWLYWYDEQGSRYPVPENALKEEKLLREREQLMRRQAEERLAEEVRSRLVIADQLELERGRFLEIAEQLQQERGLREVLEAQLEQERLQREVEVRSRLEAEQALVREKETIALNLLQENIPLETIVRTTGLTIAQLEEMKK
jgi:hypothetical protein